MPAIYSKQRAKDVQVKQQAAEGVKNARPLQIMEDIVPDNLFNALSTNGKMLQVIFFAFLFGIAMVMTKSEYSAPVKDFFNGVNAIILNIVDIIMKYAPIGVMALIAGLIVDVTGDDPKGALSLFAALGVYGLTVVAGLAFMIFGFYPVIISE